MFWFMLQLYIQVVQYDLRVYVQYWYEPVWTVYISILSLKLSAHVSATKFVICNKESLQQVFKQYIFIMHQALLD